jgi:hypothetical protein
VDTEARQMTEGPWRTAAPAAMVVGGILALIGPFLTWSSISLGRAAAAGRSQSGAQRKLGRGGDLGLAGIDTSSGRTVLALGLALIVVAVLALLAYRFWLRLGAIAAGLVVAVIALVLTLMDLFSPSPLAAVRPALIRRLGGSIPASPGPGAYLAMAGAAIAIIAATAWLLSQRAAWAALPRLRRTSAPVAPPATEEDQPTTPLPPATTPGLAPE